MKKWDYKKHPLFFTMVGLLLSSASLKLKNLVLYPIA